MARSPVPALAYPCDRDPGLAADDLQRLLGGKGAGLVRMATLGLRVPPAFTVTSEACRAFFARGWSPRLDRAVKDQLRQLEIRSGRALGDATSPLLVSVRSGAAVSMPGMMDTVLNVGMTPAVATALAARSGDPDFAWDTCRRAVVSFASVVGGLASQARAEAETAAQALSGALPLRERAEALFDLFAGLGCPIPADPDVQVVQAVAAVFRSWASTPARVYRERERIDHELGTAATVQTMVFGNLGSTSGTGVAFSRDPSSGTPGLVGDLLLRAQGEDVVGGSHRTASLAELRGRWPALWRELEDAAAKLERAFGDMVDLEFTVERGVLWLLQARPGKRSPKAVLRIAIDLAEDPSFPMSRMEAVHRCQGLLEDPPTEQVVDSPAAEDEVVTEGLAASPGRGVGVLCLDPDEAVALANGGASVVLVRRETSPADVHGIGVAAGLVTTLGGLMSHAAVVARAWGIPAIVGAEGLVIDENGVVGRSVRLGRGETVTVDGDRGLLLAGATTCATRPVPEVEVLRSWATAQRTAEAGGAPLDGRPPAAPRACIRLLGLRGTGTAEQLGEALGAPLPAVREVLEALVQDGLVDAAGGRARLSSEGRARLQQWYEEERAGGAGALAAVLDDFQALNTMFKETVTSWQTTGDEQALERLQGTVHPSVRALLEDASAVVDRLMVYRQRFDQALDRILGGDHRFVAHPAVDSYHTVWFELHEELIRLAGSDRRREAQLGRA